MAGRLRVLHRIYTSSCVYEVLAFVHGVVFAKSIQYLTLHLSLVILKCDTHSSYRSY
jgi:hypothetical protein